MSEIPKYYDVSEDEMKEVTQEYVDKSQIISRHQYSRNVAIKLIANLNVSNENDMSLLVEILNKLENRELN